VFQVYSSVDGYNPSAGGMYLPPTDESTEDITTFSDKSGQKINNTKIVTDINGNESVTLELADRIVTVVLDQSGSMTWNDNGRFRHAIAQEIVDKIDISYPGDVSYNLIDYGAKFINVLLFGIIDEGGVNPYDVNSLNAMFQADENANYDGIRVVRNSTGYPSHPLDGDIVKDGFVNRILDESLTPGQTYYYTIYTYDDLGRFSRGVNIKVTPRDRIVPRGISVFGTAVDTQDLSVGEPFVGTGVNRDENTIGIWHMDEGDGRHIYDFSDTGAILTHSNEVPIWYDARFVPAGTSGLFFDGDNDTAFYDDVDDKLVNSGDFTFMAWIFPYDIDGVKIIFSKSRAGGENFDIRYDASGNLGLGYDISATYASDPSLLIEAYKWHHVAIVYDSVAHTLTYYVNGNSQVDGFGGSPAMSSGTDVTIAGNPYDNIGPSFRGKITEVSIHNVTRSSSYINSQISESPILNSLGEEVGTEVVGIRDDNGDRLVVLDYEIPNDYNFDGGEVIIVKNDKHIPSWEEDGTIIHQEAASVGKTSISDSDDFALGQTYYYRIFSKNSLGNVSFLTDSPYLEVTIPESLTSDYFRELTSAIPNPEEPTTGELITPGNNKVYLRWRQPAPLDSRVSRVKIYYSDTDFPVVNNTGGNKNQLVFTGLPSDEKFVHRNIANNKSAYYTIVNVDKYGRPSGYNSDGSQYESLLQASTTPTSSSSEGTIPLVDVEDINYEIRDDNSITLGWSQPVKSPENIEAYFDQTVLVYASLTDEFGEVLPEYASIKMYITSEISRETQADDVFDTVSLFDFADTDAYDFFVTRTDQGFLKATLRMTSNSRIISQIKEATFKIQLKSFIPKEGGYTSPNTGSSSSNPLAEYAALLESLSGEEYTGAADSSSNNVFEYYSQEFTVHYVNPWEITLDSRNDNQRVYERCYYRKIDKITGDISLRIDNEMFYGVPMRASSPFVARAKVKYKGEPVENTSIQVAVWDADSSKLCQNAGSESKDPFGYQGEKLQPSTTVVPPDNNLDVIQGTELIPGPDGELIESEISYVDIPLYAPDAAQAVRLFVKGEQAGYSSVKDMYVLFQSLLRTEITAAEPSVDGRDVREQMVNAYVIHPDYPGDDAKAESLRTPVADYTIAQWDFVLVQGENSRSIYSTDNVPITNGVFSYTRGGHARNVFLGPIQLEGDAFDETHELSATIVYEGMSNTAKSFIDLKYDPTESTKFGARFLMEVDGSWNSSGNYTSGHWLSADNSGNALWTDGSHYKKMKIHRNPAGDPAFNATTAFNDCASQDDSQVFELNSGQIIEIITGDDEIEILHGEITEELDPYTGRHNLVVGKDGFIDNGTAFIELVNEEDSDITYFYIRANKFVPGSGPINNDFLIDDEPINECLKLKPSEGLFLRDLPEWSPYFNVSGKTTLFVNDQPLVLRGGGDFYTGIPPCPICLKEPLVAGIKWRKVTNYFYSEELGDPSNEYLYAETTEVDNNYFSDKSGESLLNNLSDVDIRLRFSWRNEPLPDGTPVYTSIGDNSSRTLFWTNQNVNYTFTEDGYSYVDVRIAARRITTTTTTEKVEIYAVYDDNGKTERRVGHTFSLTIDVKNVATVPPVLPVIDPSAEPVEPPVTAFTGIMDKYDINTDTWSTVDGMNESRGNFFIGEAGGKIYTFGGLMNNTLNISDKTEEYNIISDTWSYKTIMPTPRFGGMSVVIGNDIYTIGGIREDDTVNGLSVSGTVEVYHADTDSWDTLEDMPVVGAGFAEERLWVAFGSAQHVVRGGNNYIYVVGGFTDAIINSSTFKIRTYNQRISRYHVETNTWEYSSILRSNELGTYQRISPSTLTYDDKLIVFNGAIESGNNFIFPSDDFYINIESILSNTPSDGTWVKFGSGLLNGFPVPKFQAAMARYDINPSVDIYSQYYLLGGGNNDSTSLDLVENLTADINGFNYSSSYDSNASEALSPLVTGRHGAGAIYSDASGYPSIYLVGGYTSAQGSSFVDIVIDI